MPFSIQLGLQDPNVSQANLLLLTPAGSCGECPQKIMAPQRWLMSSATALLDQAAV